MAVESLLLVNFVGILDGLGLERLSIDFKDLPPNGLFAITGENGTGKTTVLDNLHPWRLMPYKLRDSAAGWTPTAFSYYDQCRDQALKELIFTDNGKRYQSKIVIDVPKRKQEAYLLIWDDNKSNWEPLNDGKTGTYDETVNRLFGSPQLFFTAQFRGQGAPRISSYTRGDMFDVIAEMINAKGVQEDGAKASKVATLLQTDLAEIESKLEETIALRKKDEELAQQESECAAGLSANEDQRKITADSIAKEQGLLQELGIATARRDEVSARLANLNQQLSDEQVTAGIAEGNDTTRLAEATRDREKAETLVATKAKELARATEEDQQSRVSLTAFETRRGTLHLEITQTRERLQELETAKTSYEKAAVQLSALDKQVEAEKTSIATSSATDASRIQEASRDREHAQNILTAKEQELSLATAERGQILSSIANMEQEFASIPDPAGLAKATLNAEDAAKKAQADHERCLDILTATRIALDDYREREKSIARLTGELKHFSTVREANISRFTAELESVGTRTRLLEDLDCFDNGSGNLNESCPLLKDALMARDLLPELKKSLEEAQGKSEAETTVELDLRLLKQKHEAAGDVATAETNARTAEDTSRQMLANANAAVASTMAKEQESLNQRGALLERQTQLNAKRDELGRTINRLTAEIAATTARLNDLKERENQLHQEIGVRSLEQNNRLQALLSERDRVATEAGPDINAEYVFCQEILGNLQKEASTLEATIAATVAKLEVRTAERLAKEHKEVVAQAKELSAREIIVKEEIAKNATMRQEHIQSLLNDRNQLITNMGPDCSAELAACRTRIASLETLNARLDTAIRDLSVTKGGLAARRQGLAQAIAAASPLEQEAAALRMEIAAWRQVAKGFSNDGIVALEIDDSGAPISAKTNDLLAACYGPRFSVRLETQVEKVKGKGAKEAFDITVFDADRGTTKSLCDMSGGEDTWIDDALTRAISLYNAEKSGHLYDEMFCDEHDGPLSPARKQEFVVIKRRAMEIGGHKREFFISQTAEVVRQADALIEMVPGIGAVITVPDQNLAKAA